MRHGAIARFGDLGQGRVPDLFAETIELAETHDERPPFIRVNAIFEALHQDRFFYVCAHDPDFECQGRSGFFGAIAEWVCRFQHCFELNRALLNSWSIYNL